MGLGLVRGGSTGSRSWEEDGGELGLGRALRGLEVL